MKEIILLRHGQASNIGEKNITVDEERTITSKGKKSTLHICDVLSSMKYHPGLILTSPLIRAKETASIAAERLKYAGKIKEVPFLSPGIPPEEVITEIKKIRVSLFILVGHMPDLSSLGTFLITGKPSTSGLNLSKSGACSISFKSTLKEGTGQLNWLIQPKLIKSLS
jgi:phosphohistidine phosphatase